LREGTEISLEQNYNRKEITIHGRRVVGERGIIVSPREPYTRVITPTYGVDIAPIAERSSPGQTDQFARVDHTHEGVHALERLTGDISIDVTQGLRKVVDVPNIRKPSRRKIQCLHACCIDIKTMQVTSPPPPPIVERTSLWRCAL